MSVTLRQYMPVVVVLCACYFSTLDGLAVRPFTSSKANPSCSGQTRNATLGCPCRLNDVPCRDSGSLCIQGICQCASGSTTANGATCLPLFNAVPTLALVSVPCQLGVGDSIPGLKIGNNGGELPLFCNTGGGIPASTPVTVNVISSQINNGPEDSNSATVINVPIVSIDPTGDIFINQLADVSAIPAITLRQTYSGFCISNAGITSNTFQFTVEFPSCP